MHAPGPPARRLPSVEKTAQRGTNKPLPAVAWAVLARSRTPSCLPVFGSRINTRRGADSKADPCGTNSAASSVPPSAENPSAEQQRNSAVRHTSAPSAAL
ncbi:MAG: hypothetical protein U0797_04135 [Gemmataceae bacterium]